MKQRVFHTSGLNLATQASSRIFGRRHGFTLAEVVLAVGLISLFLLAIVGLIAPANRSIMRIVALDKLTRSYSVIDGHLNRTSATEHDAIRFARLFNMVQQAPAAETRFDVSEEELLVVFSYRAEMPIEGNTVEMDANSGLPPVYPPPGNDVTPRQGIDYFVYDAVLPLDEFIAFLPNQDQRPALLEGDTFIAVLTQSDVNPAEQTVDNYTVQAPDANNDGIPDSVTDDYPEAVVVANVQFFTVNRVNNQGLLEAVGSNDNTPNTPILDLNMGFNR